MGKINKKLALKKVAPVAPEAPVASPSIQKTGLKNKESSILMLKKPENPMKATRMKKKDKLKLKRKGLENKLEQAHNAKAELKAKKKRDKVPIIGDTKPMSDTLKMLDAILEEDDRQKAKQSAKKKPVQKRKVKTKDRNSQFTKDLHLFAQVKKHKEFLKDPFNTIGTHLENKALADAAMDDNDV
ncbi:ribosome biogenesis protein SLX9 homolog [Tigriopus californicus]|uniref:ribosome biogenesis protein SLX9 homolog n=1 Tax=Tigriopus californicus TaxID=6832 RepID=UPI0027D9F2D0|nr:ribosome biogenesis protein SLX9 homolog [Tigriopus californicus]